jgi:DNA-binding MarR family transcriptional regulator
MSTADLERALGGLTREEGRAWSAFLRAAASLTRAMSADLENAHGLPLTSYDVLRQLALAPDRRLRMTDLAGRVMLSRPGLTGVVARLEGEGLIEREQCAEDRRGWHAVLTDAGWRRLLEVHPTHVASIQERFADRYTKDDLRTLADLLEHLAEP